MQYIKMMPQANAVVEIPCLGSNELLARAFANIPRIALNPDHLYLSLLIGPAHS
jgi:hypothetical protein